MRSIRVPILVAVAAATALLLACPYYAGAGTHRWTFDGDLTDANGTADAVAQGNAYVGTNNGAYAGSGALVLDGFSDSVFISDTVLEAGDFTIAFWAKDNYDQEASYFFRVISNNNNFTMMRFPHEGYGFDVYTYPWFTGVQGVPAFISHDGDPPAWHQITMTYDESQGKLRTYVDGTFRTLMDGNGPYGGQNGNFYIGDKEDNTRGYSGLIDDFQVYDRCFDADQVAWLASNPGSAYIAGDANDDGMVDETDLGILTSNWLATGATWNMGDFNDDGIVNDVDATMLASNWQSGVPQQAVPEPSTLILLAGAFAALFMFRRQRK